MGIRLRLLSWWTPRWFQTRGLDELAKFTIQGLQNVVKPHSTTNNNSKSNNSKYDNPIKTISPRTPIQSQYKSIKNGNLDSNSSLKKIVKSQDLDEKRKIMAQTHNDLVEILTENVGTEKAVQYGREAMFQKGLELGQRYKGMLGVGKSTEDLIRAARILYKVLGIDFTVKIIDDKMFMVVNHCALAEFYKPVTCQILSATDEGVVQGLNSNIKIEFTKRITEGCLKCIAPIRVLKNDEHQ